MTRAQGLRSSRRKPLTSSQDIIPKYCKENSPSILSQNSRRVVQAKSFKENTLPTGLKRKPNKSSQDIIPEHCKKNTASVLNKNCSRAGQVKINSDDCKENVSPNGPNRKLVKACQENIPEHCKENSPSLLIKKPSRAGQVKKNRDDCKENVSLKDPKIKLIKTSQDNISEYCKENSPSVLNQKPSIEGQVKNKSNNCKENVMPKSPKRKLIKANQANILEYCKENSSSFLNNRSRRAAQAQKTFDSIKENISPKRSKRKPVKASQDIIPEYRNENSSSILTHNSNRAVQAQKVVDNCKENISPESLCSSSKVTPLKTNQVVFSPLRKSRRHPNSTKIVQPNKPQSERIVLSDTTNSLQAGLCKNNIFHKIIKLPQPSTITSNKNTDHENHIPVYKTVCPLKSLSDVEPIPEKKEAVYEFEVDENEEPVLKKKRKKRAYTRKPKTGPKALTINNIKYSSTESLASLPEKPICKTKNTFVKPKLSNIRPCSSVATLNDSCVSVPSFMSHPNLPLRDNRCELSVLQESQSEQCPTLDSTLLEAPVTQSPSTSGAAPLTLSHSHHNLFSPNPRCYGSKSSRTPNPYNDDQNAISDFQSQQASSSATNVSSSSHDFLSSTPCKRFSMVVRDNSVFDDSPGIRPSTGLIQDASLLTVPDDNCFGFDEPEELEEPLVSPIKSSIDLQPRRISKFVPKSHGWEEPPKPSIQEVIELLKANIPKPDAKKDTTMFVSSPQSSEPTSPTVVENDSPVFIKPARRSYERKKRVHYYNSDSEEEEEHVEETKIDNTIIKEDKKCYKKVNTSKTVRAPKITKAKQRIAKEEEEMEKMAALMNAQFQEIDKMDLVVE